MAQKLSFKEYISQRFYDNFFCAIKEYLDDNIDSIDLRLYKVRNIESLELLDIEVKFVSVNDLPDMAIEFDVAIEAEISAREADYHYDETEECQQWFMIHCNGDISKKLNDFEIKKPISIYDGKNKQPEPLSDALVPIKHKEDLDKVAENFLRKNYPSALYKPCTIDPMKLAENMGLTVKFARITKEGSVFGRCYFRDCETELYNPILDTTYIESIPAKTILVDKEVAFLRNLGSLNNTIVHECVHWDMHRKAFALAQLYDETLSSIGCKVVGGVVENNTEPVKWMEWQANSLAPRIQMPIEGFKKKVSEIISEFRLKRGECDMIDIIEPIIEKIAIEYGVSRTAAKIRMVDAGYDEAIGAFNFIDGRYVQPHKARKGYLAPNRTFSIEAKQAAILSLMNTCLRETLSKGQYQFVDSHFVLNSPKFLEIDEVGKTQLTHYARNHMDECCLVFELSVANRIGEKYHSECFLNRDEHSNIDLNVNFSNGYENSPKEKQLKLLSQTIAEEYEILSHLPNDYSLALKYVIDWRNRQVEETKKVHPHKRVDKITAKEIAKRAEINEATVRRTINGEKTSTNTLILICFALHLPYEISRHIIDHSPCPLRMSDPNHQFYAFALRVHYGKTVSEVKQILKEYGANPL